MVAEADSDFVVVVVVVAADSFFESEPFDSLGEESAEVVLPRLSVR